MATRSSTTALTLYDKELLTLEEAADYTGVSTGRMARTLGSWGIRVRDEDQQRLAAHATN